MKILGVDCSSKSIGCVQLEGDLLKSAMLYGGDKNDFETRLNVMFYLTRDLLHEWEPDIVYIERAIYLQNPKTTLMIDAVVNLIRFACIDKQIAYQMIDNKSWKKIVLRNGNASKDEVRSFVHRTFGEEGLNTQDLCDAVCIALSGAVEKV